MDFGHRDEHVDEQMVLVQANLDDMNTEWTSYVMDRLFEAGANDVYWIPIVMKKGRPGVMLNVLVEKTLLPAIEEIVFRETTTLGIRYFDTVCHRLERRFVKVETLWGEITVKAGFHHGNLVQYAPEFKECEQAALQHRIPLKMVYDEVRQRFPEFYGNNHTK